MRLFFNLILLSVSLNLYSQKFYKTSGGELIFSRALTNTPIENSSSRLRFSAFFHYNQHYHYNFSDAVGCFSGFSISNIGFIYKSADTTFKKRAYTLGIPIGIKFGNLADDHYFFAGGEIEFPFHYKQKKMFDQRKYKYSSFFDDRTDRTLPSVFAGIQFQGGLCLKIRLYLSDFLNGNFKGNDFGSPVNYADINSRLYLISVSYNLKETKFKKIIKYENNRYATLNI